MPPKLFCGNIREPPDTLPDGYEGYDTQYNCLRKGVGIGLYLSRNGRQRNRVPPIPIASSTTTRLPWWVILIIIMLVIVMLLIIILIIWMFVHK